MTYIKQFRCQGFGENNIAYTNYDPKKYLIESKSSLCGFEKTHIKMTSYKLNGLFILAYFIL